MLSKSDKYIGEEQHGYWWTHYDGTIKFSKTLYGVSPEDFFRYSPWVRWWHVRCELDWYRMCKEIRNLEIDPIVA